MDIRIKIVPNPLYGRPGSLVECEYMGQVVHTGTATAADVCEACKQENPQMTEPLASLATETIMDYGSDKVVTDVVRFNLGSPYFTMEPAVSGSVPTVDAPLTDANERYIKVVNGQSLNARIAALKPVITGEDLGDVMFRSTETTHDGEDWKNTIFGSEEFVALGKRLGGEGQRMELVDATGTVRGEATFVSGDALGQRFTYKLTNPPAEDFEGKLILTSTGKDTPDASPKTIKVSVKFVAPPKRVSISYLDACNYSEGTAKLTLKGENLDCVAGYSVDGEGHITLPAEFKVNGGDYADEPPVFTGTGDTLTCDLNMMPDDDVVVTLRPDTTRPDVDPEPATASATGHRS